MYSEQPSPPQKELPSQPDAELYQALRSGQANVLGILYDRHAGLVYGVSLKILGNSQEAEDLTQDISRQGNSLSNGRERSYSDAGI